MPYLLYLFLGIIPSLLWLAYFLRKDLHPEPKAKIVRIFLWGALATLPALGIELGVEAGLEHFGIELPYLLGIVVTVFLAVALVEEFFKYIVVRWRAMSSKEFDEPIDAMIYMITAAMGFATVENVFNFFKPDLFDGNFGPWEFALLRFLGPTLLHALASATVGFFIAAAILREKYRTEFLLTGLLLATLLHGFFNSGIMEASDYVKLQFVAVVLAAGALFVAWALTALKRLKSVCLPGK